MTSSKGRDFQEVLVSIIDQTPGSESKLHAGLDKILQASYYTAPEGRWLKHCDEVANLLRERIGNDPLDELPQWQRDVLITFNPEVRRESRTYIQEYPLIHFQVGSIDFTVSAWEALELAKTLSEKAVSAIREDIKRQREQTVRGK